MKTFFHSVPSVDAQFVFHQSDQFSSSSDAMPMNGLDFLERMRQMQMGTDKELNNYGATVQINRLDKTLGLPALIASKHSEQAFRESGWSQQYEKRFGKAETGNFFRHPENVLRKESLYSVPARQSAIDTQFRMTKEALDSRQKDNELLYLGSADQKSLQNIIEKQLTKEAGGLFTIAEWMKTGLTSKNGRTRRQNERLAKKITEGMNIPAERSASIADAITGNMSKNADNVSQVESAAAAQAGMQIEDFRKTNRGKKLTAELFHLLVTGGFIAAKVMAASAAGVAVSPLIGLAAIPILGLNIKGRVPMGLDGDVITDKLRAGENLTETIENTARELDSTLHMTQNLINSSEILARGRNVRYLHGVDQRYSNLRKVIDHKQMQFDMTSLGDQSLETKTMYETLGFVVDAQGQIQLKEAEKFKNILYSRGERIFGDRKSNKSYKRSLNILEDSLPANASLRDVIALNQKKVLELDNIIALAEAEIGEDTTRSKLFRPSEKKTEGRRSMLRQLKRFSKTQRYFVNDQRTFALLKDLGDRPSHSMEAKKQDLYEAAVITFLGSFDSADQLMSKFGSSMSLMHPDGRNFTPDSAYIKTTLEEYYRSSDSQSVLQKILCSTDFETWMMSVGSFTNMHGSHKTLPSMERFSCQANAIHQRKVCDYKDYNFDSDFVVSPKGTKFYLPLGVPLGVLENTATQVVADEVVKNSMSGIEAGVQIPAEVLAAIEAANASSAVATSVPTPFMANFWAPTGISAGYGPNIAGTIAGGIASTARRYRNNSA